MGINIDSYIEELVKTQKAQNEEKEKSLQNEKKEEKVNLDFDKNVEQNLSKIQNEGKDTNDLEKLQQIYEEIKNFDQSLPEKFLSVEDLGNSSLEIIGKKYSQEYFNDIQKTTKELQETLDNKINEISQDLIDRNYTRIPLYLKELRDMLKLIPSSFELLLAETKSKIKKIEIDVLNAIENFKENELKNIKQQLNNEIQTLLNNLVPNNSQFIKEQINHVEHMFESIPAILRVTLTKEQLIVNKSILKAQNFLQEEIQKNINTNSQEIIKLEEEFNTAIFNKDLDRALVYYNQILQVFSKIPDYPFEEKIKMLEKIFNIHSKMQKLYINNNVNLFLETYNYSKTLEEIRDYVEKAKTSPQLIKKENINLLINKLNQIPSEYIDNKNELLNELDNINNNKYINQNESISKHDYKHNPNFNFGKRQQNNPNIGKKQQTKKYNPNSFSNHTKEYEQKYAIHSKIIEEIDSLYKEFRNTKSKKNAKIKYDKILFYLGFANITNEKKESIKQKLSQEWAKKE